MSKKSVSVKSIINASNSIVGSKGMKQAQKEAFCSPADGSVRVLQLDLFDADGNPTKVFNAQGEELSFTGKVRISKSGGLTSTINMRNVTATTFTVDASEVKDAAEKLTSDELAASLLG